MRPWGRAVGRAARADMESAPTFVYRVITMLLNKNTILPAAPAAKPVQYALKALRRDFDRVFADTAAPGGRILLTINDTLPAEQYTLTADADTLLLSAADAGG